MSAFKRLKDISNNFEQQLRGLSICSVKNNETFEDRIGKKMKDLTFRTSKLRLLKAKQIDAYPQNAAGHSGDTVKEYGDAAMWKVLEQTIVKSLTQTHAVKTLITTADENLDPEMLERKIKIIQSLKEYRHIESVLSEEQRIEEANEEELSNVRKEWDEELTSLRQLQEEASEFDECDISGPLYDKLRKVVNKLEIMRWLVCRLVTSRTSYDWLAAPERTARALRLTRTHYSVRSFVNNDE